jgi:membrane-bound serine protease (ClpP class)
MRLNWTAAGDTPRARRCAPWHRLRRRLLGGLVAAVALAPHTAGGAQPRARTVVVAPIAGTIDLGLAPFVERVLREAARDSVDAVILDINTLGGRVDAALVVRDALLGARVPTVAWIHPRAISAGALIALASERVAIAGGGTIGAATPVQAGMPGAPAAPVEEKMVSYLRKEFGATAERRGRPMPVAEAMVDADVAIPGLIAKGKLLTLSTDEALARRIADLRADSLPALLAALGLEGAAVRPASVNWAERVVRLLTHPVVASLLLSAGLVGIMVEIRTPGFGVPGILGGLSLALHLGGHWLVRLAGWEELLLVGAGVLLLAAELFVLPGFGVAGVLGLLSLVGGLSLSLVGAGATWAVLVSALGQVALATAVALVASLLLLRVLTRAPLGRRLVLDTRLDAEAGWASAPEADHRLPGTVGVAHSMLRPAGIAELGGARVDVVSDGEWIEAGAPVVVARVDGNRVVVRRHERAATHDDQEP